MLKSVIARLTVVKSMVNDKTSMIMDSSSSRERAGRLRRPTLSVGCLLGEATRLHGAAAIDDDGATHDRVGKQGGNASSPKREAAA